MSVCEGVLGSYSPPPPHAHTHIPHKHIYNVFIPHRAAHSTLHTRSRCTLLHITRAHTPHGHHTCTPRVCTYTECSHHTQAPAWPPHFPLIAGRLWFLLIPYGCRTWAFHPILWACAVSPSFPSCRAEHTPEAPSMPLAWLPTTCAPLSSAW
jgi:hypothetical protein